MTSRTAPAWPPAASWWMSKKVTDEEMEGWKRDYPEAFARKVDYASGVCLEGWLIDADKEGI